MSSEPTIHELNAQKDAIIKEEERFFRLNKRTQRLLNILKKNEDDWFPFVGAALAAIIAFIWAYIYYDGVFTWNHFWSVAFLWFYPGLYVWMILGAMVSPIMPWVLRNLFRVSKGDLKSFEEIKARLSNEKYSIDKRIIELQAKEEEAKRIKAWNEKRAKDKEKELNLLQSLRELITKLENKTITRPEAIEWNSLLADDNVKIKAAGYQVEKSITFTNLFKKIERLIFPSATTAVASPTPTSPITQPAPNPPINKPEIKKVEEKESTLTPEYQEKAKRQYLRIVSEAFFIYRLEWFASMLKRNECPKKYASLIYRLLNQEYQEYLAFGFIVHPPNFYESQLKELRSFLTNEREVIKSTPTAPSTKPTVVTETKNESHEAKPKPAPEDKTITEIFGSPQSTSDATFEPKEKTFKILPKKDYESINKQKIDIGNLGELFVYWKERNKLMSLGLKHLSDKVQHISKESDSFGYDIISFFEDGTPTYLEVKTTTSGPKTPFEMSTSEIAAMNKLDNYYIVRVFDFNPETGKGSTYTVNKSQFNNHFDLEPTSFRAKPKK